MGCLINIARGLERGITILWVGFIGLYSISFLTSDSIFSNSTDDSARIAATGLSFTILVFPLVVYWTLRITLPRSRRTQFLISLIDSAIIIISIIMLVVILTFLFSGGGITRTMTEGSAITVTLAFVAFFSGILFYYFIYFTQNSNEQNKSLKKQQIKRSVQPTAFTTDESASVDLSRASEQLDASGLSGIKIKRFCPSCDDIRHFHLTYEALDEIQNKILDPEFDPIEAECPVCAYADEFHLSENEQKRILKSMGHTNDIENIDDKEESGLDGLAEVLAATADLIETISELDYAANRYQMIRRLKGHKQTIMALDFSPNGELIASASADKTVGLWNISTNRTQQKFLKGYKDKVFGAVFSRSGERLASACLDGTVRVVNIANGKVIWTQNAHKGGAIFVAFSPDDTLLASCGADKTIKVWKASTGKLIHTFSGHQGKVWTVDFDPVGKQIVSSSDDKTVRLWTLSSGKVVILHKHKKALQSAVFSPDGTYIASAGHDNTAMLWNTTSGSAATTFQGHGDTIGYLRFSHDSKLLATASDDKTIKLWDVESRSLLTTLNGNTKMVNGLAFDPTNKILAGAVGNQIKLWIV